MQRWLLLSYIYIYTGRLWLCPCKQAGWWLEAGAIRNHVHACSHIQCMALAVRCLLLVTSCCLCIVAGLLQCLLKVHEHIDGQVHAARQAHSKLSTPVFVQRGWHFTHMSRSLLQFYGTNVTPHLQLLVLSVRHPRARACVNKHAPHTAAGGVTRPMRCWHAAGRRHLLTM